MLWGACLIYQVNLIIAQFANCILIGQRQLGVCHADIQVWICVISSRGRSKLELDLIFFCIYSMDFKMDRDGKGANPREHRERCDRGE